MADKRKHFRRQSSGDFEVYSPDDDSIIGYILNLSRRGILFKSEKAYDIDKVLNCKLKLPVRLKGKNNLTFELLVKRCTLIDNGESYEVAGHIINISKYEMDVIDQLTHLWMIQHSDSRKNSTVFVKK